MAAVVTAAVVGIGAFLGVILPVTLNVVGHDDKRRSAASSSSQVDALFAFEGPLSDTQTRDVMQGMNVTPSGGDLATFELAGREANGSLTGGDRPSVNGLLYGDFATVFQDYGLEGRWITINRTEASEATEARFEGLKAAVGEANGALPQNFAFADMMAAAAFK